MKVPGDIIIFALPKHDDAFTSTPWQLAVSLSEHYRVWYISHPYTLIDYWKMRKDGRAGKRWASTFGKELLVEQTEHENLKIIYAPLTLPINGLPPGNFYNFFSQWNQRWVAGKLNRWLQAEGINEAIFINSHDFYFPDLPKLLQIKCLEVYHCIDPIVKAYSARHGLKLEKQAATQADLVISTSPYLQQKMKTYNSRSYLVPNAANYQLSSKAAEDALVPLESINRIKGIKIGYIGNIERRINYSLLEATFRKHPDWQLVMVGPSDLSFIPDTFLQLPNLHMIPAIEHQDLPRAMKALDVLIIPFLKDQVSAQIYPLKLFEYLGSGKPVIVTDFNTDVTDELKDVLEVSHDQDSFEESIHSCLSQIDQQDLISKRMAVASANDWSSRAAQLIEIFNLAYGYQRENQVQS